MPRVVVLDTFLPPHARSDVVSHILSRESEFIPSQVTLRKEKTGTVATGTATTPTKEALAKDAATRGTGLRRSRVIEAPGPQLRTLFVPHLRHALVAAFVQPGPPGAENAEHAEHAESRETEDRRPVELKIEVQLTASGDGDFYGVHSDGGPNRYSHRDVSFVYFLRTDPGCFTGGELRLEALPPGGALPQAREQLIEPKDNRLVMFPSRRRHEILPVYMPSGEFRHSRFTVNGWVSLRGHDGPRESRQDS